VETLSTIPDLERLGQLMDVAIDATSLDDFCSQLNEG
jgi:hypothetical protein